MRRFDLHQALAEKKSRRLIFAMVVMQVATVALCTAFVSLNCALVYLFFFPESVFPNFPVTVFSAILAAMGVTTTIIAGGYLKMSELDGGGSKVAEGLRGELIDETNLHILSLIHI